MGSMAGNVVVFLLMFLCVTLALGFAIPVIEYRLFNKMRAPYSSKRRIW